MSMDDTPVSYALEVVCYELRLPLMSMRAALDVLEWYGDSPELRAAVPPIRAHVHRLGDHLQHVIDALHPRMTPPTDAPVLEGMPRTQMEHALVALNTFRTHLHDETLLLDQRSLPLHAIATATLTETTHHILTVFLIYQARWTRDSMNLLRGVRTRLEQAAQE